MKLYMETDFRSTQSTRTGLAQGLVEGAGGPDPWIHTYKAVHFKLKKDRLGQGLGDAVQGELITSPQFEWA
jgi:hypothetical protein